jgi:hypothetical protein
LKKALSILIILQISLLIGVCSAANWQQVTTITGATSQTTDYFHIPTKEWRITWQITPTPGAEDLAVLGVFIYPKGESNHYVDSITKFAGNTQNSGTNYIHEGAKDYYLTIESANIQSYTFTIENDAQSTTSPASNINTILNVIIIALFAAAIGSAMVFALKRKKTNAPQNGA